jgi:hypothetical protein
LIGYGRNSPTVIRAWANFEFIDDDGKVNEVDALILSPGGLFLVENALTASCVRPAFSI